MSIPTPVEPGHAAAVEQDAVEGVVKYMPLVLPIAAGVLMLMLASIAVYLA
ncbi:MAG: hypothetical protein JWQ03_2978 [Variovorax sp.]|nr:hypothetical protein [Variovorax sp.]